MLALSPRLLTRLSPAPLFLNSHASVVTCGENGERMVRLVVQQPRSATKQTQIAPAGQDAAASKTTAGKPRIKFHAGQYCFLTFPQLSNVESHPFTISSAPTDEAKHAMDFHIKTLGDYTSRLAKLVEVCVLVRVCFLGVFEVAMVWS